ncbi:hypothetical protein FD754_010237 [Muntiacus muntjak]|uniref:Exonuclease domain-containing protein n=1 Tax=Muntiacus muntjak TaxID=9888 RepID=A0A5N3WWS2_MUNMU|nr:hypothetical protein FD754_010237 [Muntiacus muntjak]
MATASPAADGGRGRPWEGGLVSWPPAPPLTIPWTWMGPSWGQHPGHWGFPALTEPSASPAASLGIFEVRRVLDASGCSMLAPLQTGAARFSSYLLSRARKVLGSHLFSPCGVPEFCSISTRKLAAHSFGASMAAMMSFPPQRYHYFLVLDFEATCDKPQIHPQLTGIIQAMVDGQPSLQQVLERVDEWMAKEGLLDPNVKSIFVTCGDWDLKVILLLSQWLSLFGMHNRILKATWLPEEMTGADFGGWLGLAREGQPSSESESAGRSQVGCRFHFPSKRF